MIQESMMYVYLSKYLVKTAESKRKNNKKKFTNQLEILQILLYIHHWIRTDHRYIIHPNIAQIYNTQFFVHEFLYQSDAIPLIAYIKGCIYEPLS